MTNYEREMETKMLRRIRNEDKTHARLSRLEDKAEKVIGELTSGKCYIFPVGGRYREGTRAELIAFMVRNRYVR